VFTTFSSVPVISISNAQRASGAACQLGPHDPPRPAGKIADAAARDPSYLAVLGRIAPEKGSIAPSRSRSDAASRSRSPRRSIGRPGHYDEIMRPLMDHPLVEYIGEISDHEKSDFLSGAIGLLVPIDWPEPFAWVMIEAMACGTPVIAYNRGSVPEIIDEGLTGFIVEDETSAVSAVNRLSGLSRHAIRKQFETRFTHTAWRSIISPSIAADGGPRSHASSW